MQTQGKRYTVNTESETAFVVQMFHCFARYQNTYY